MSKQLEYRCVRKFTTLKVHVKYLFRNVSKIFKFINMKTLEKTDLKLRENFHNTSFILWFSF